MISYHNVDVFYKYVYPCDYTNNDPPFVLVGVQVFDFFNREVTKANCFQTKEVYSVSQDLLSVLDGESHHRRLFSRNSLTSLSPCLRSRAPNFFCNCISLFGDKLLEIRVRSVLPTVCRLSRSSGRDTLPGVSSELMPRFVCWLFFYSPRISFSRRFFLLFLLQRRGRVWSC